MAAELCYTSSRQGLFPPAHGFCTVAASAGLPTPDIEQLEGLSGYRPLFALDHPRVDRNPVAFAHTLVGGGRGGGAGGGRRRSVLTRAAHAGADYTGRNNKFVHHLLLEDADRAAAGPAWMLGQTGLMRTAWAHAPQTLERPPALPAGDTEPAVCGAWHTAAGDAGWGGVLAEWHLLNPAAPAWLVYDPEKHDPLRLTAEAIALLPHAHRWSVTFNTYFTPTTGGPDCAWRWVIAGTPAAHAADGARVIDLNAPLGPAHASRYVDAARTGRCVRRVRPVAEPPAKPTPAPNPAARPDAAPPPDPARPASTPGPSSVPQPDTGGARHGRRVAAAVGLPVAAVLAGYALLPGPEADPPPPPRHAPIDRIQPAIQAPATPPAGAAGAADAAPALPATGPAEDPAPPPAAEATAPRPPAPRSEPTPPPVVVPTPPVARVFTELPAPRLEAGAGLGRLARLLPQETLLAEIDGASAAAYVVARHAAEPDAPLRLVEHEHGVAARLHTAGPLGQPQVRTLGATALTERGLVWRWHAVSFAPSAADPTLDDLHDRVRFAVFTVTDAAGHVLAEAQGLVPTRIALRPGDAAQPLPPRLDRATPRFVLRDSPPGWTLASDAPGHANATLRGAGGATIRLHRGSHLAARWADDSGPAGLSQRIHDQSRTHADLTDVLDALRPLQAAAKATAAALPKTDDGKPDYDRRDQPEWKKPFDRADAAENRLALFLAEHAPDGIDATRARAAELARALSIDRARLSDHADLHRVVIDLLAHPAGARLVEITFQGYTP